MRALAWSLPILLLLPITVLADEGHKHDLTEQEIGAVHFATSCSKREEKSLNAAVALLHSFQYEQARQRFAKIAEEDPSCAMAQWGIAMSYYHGLWDNSDLDAGRAALAKALALSDARTTARENAYINALAEIYREDGKDMPAHARAFEQKMADVQAAYPADIEAAIFHALTLAITAPKTDKTFANQRKCGEILEPIFNKLPNHPGVAHYIIHCYDNPVLAEQGLDAARAYAKIAPASAHAHHMPSHLFTRVGAWQDAIASNLHSAQLAAAVEATSTSGEARDQRLHAMDYLEYAYLQSGRVKEALDVLNEMRALPPLPGATVTGDYATAAIPARYAVELGKWEEASKLEARAGALPWTQALTWMAVGIGSARSGHLDRAALAVKNLAVLRDESTERKNPYWSSQVEVQRREVAAWIAEKKGNVDDALSMMRSAADLEDTMDKNAVTPGAITPAREMLAELLSLEQNPKLAVVEYESVLKLAPNRFNALYGAATSAAAAGQLDTARTYFQKLTETATGSEREELATARKKLIELKE